MQSFLIVSYVLGTLIYFLKIRKMDTTHALKIGEERRNKKIMDGMQTIHKSLGAPLTEEELKGILDKAHRVHIPARKRYIIVGKIIRSVLWPVSIVEDALRKGV